MTHPTCWGARVRAFPEPEEARHCLAPVRRPERVSAEAEGGVAGTGGLQSARACLGWRDSRLPRGRQARADLSTDKSAGLHRVGRRTRIAHASQRGYLPGSTHWSEQELTYKPVAWMKTNASLQNFDKGNPRFSSINDRRSAARIAVIDDNPFDPEVNLRSHGYDIRQVGDIKKIKEVEGYPIVLCDLMGVGLYFDKKHQGNRLIKEIRINYPATYVLAYTGAGWGQPAAQAASHIADDVVQKDISIEEWVEKLDEYVKRATDPFAIWDRTRTALVRSGIDTKDLLLLEDAYVRLILERRGQLTGLSSIVSGRALQGDVRAIIQGLIASAIFKAIAG